MKRLISLGICLFIGAALFAQEQEQKVVVRAKIDGRSRLMVRGDRLWWYHIEFTAPGRHEGDAPTLINDQQWMPRWPDKNGDVKNEFAYCESSKFQGLKPALPLGPCTVDLSGADGRGEVSILQQPGQANGYTLIIEANDNDAPGSADYAIEYTVSPAPPDATTKPAAKADVPKDGLAAEYLLDGDATDTGPQKRNGEVVGAKKAPDRFGRADRAMSFDGKSFITINPAPEMAAGRTLSISAWVNYSEFSPDDWSNALICQDDGKDRRVFQLSTHGNRAVWHRMMRYGWDCVGLMPMTTGRWYHLAATYDGKVQSLYIDGVLQQSMPGELELHGEEPLYIGRKGSDETQFNFKGRIDDVRIYDRALSAGEVAGLSAQR